MQCRIAYVGHQGNYNVHVRNCDGSGVQRVTDLVTAISAPEHPVWSPDGQRILFVSRHEGQQLTSSGEPVGSLYTIRADGSGLTRLTRNASDDQPAWSPDGTQITFHRNCNLAVMNADGTRVAIIARPHEDSFCIDQSAWSPDGKRIAFTSLKWPSPGFLTEQAVFVVNPDGSNSARLAAVPAENWVEYNVVWSPDGAQVAFSVAGRKYIVSADGNGKPAEVSSIPESWFPWYWPQWAGETGKATPTPAPGSQADQARAFAEPILRAIASRRPEFEDDFSRDDKGWLTDQRCGQIVGGRLRTSIIPEQMAQQSDGHYTCGAHNPGVLNVTNFVFETDLTQAQTGIQGGAGVQWRHTNGYYRVAVDVPGQRWALLKSSTSLPGGVGLETLQEWQGLASGRIRVIARGNRFAVYINETPVFYLQDDLNPNGEIDLWLNAPGGPVAVEYDNIKLWNLDNVPGLP